MLNRDVAHILHGDGLAQRIAMIDPAAKVRGNSADVDDPPPSAHSHAWQKLLAEPVQRTEVAVDGLLENCVVHRRTRPVVDVQPGVGDEYINPPKCGLRFAGQFLDLIGPADICGYCNCTSRIGHVDGVGNGDKRLGLASADHHISTVLGQPVGYRTADPAAGASHQGSSTGKVKQCTSETPARCAHRAHPTQDRHPDTFEQAAGPRYRHRDHRMRRGALDASSIYKDAAQQLRFGRISYRRVEEMTETDPKTGPDEQFMAFLAQGRFMIQRGTLSGKHVFFPRVVAPGTGEDLEWVEASGIGVVHSTTVVRKRPPEPNFNVALVDLAEGPRMMSRVEGIDPAEVRIGMAVRARIIDGEDGPLVVFVPEATHDEAAAA